MRQPAHPPKGQVAASAALNLSGKADNRVPANCMVQVATLWSPCLSDTALLHTPLHDLHVSLGARMVPFAGYSMPVQYPLGLMAEHKHTRHAAGLFDVSHMGQLRLVGPDAAAAFESLIPVDVVGLSVGKQRYGLLLNDQGGILDDLMFVNRGDDIFVVVNGACKAADIAHIQARIGNRCEVIPLPDMALLALQGPQAVDALSHLLPGVEKLVFMSGQSFDWQGVSLFITRSGYTGEDGFEISVSNAHATDLANALLEHSAVQSIGLGARNSLRLEAGLCLYGQDIDTTTTNLYKNFNKRKSNEPTKSNNNIRNNMTKKDYIDRKQRALKYKSDSLLEFRLFESSSDINTLLMYTGLAIELLHKTYKQMVKAGEKIPLEPLKVNIARPKVKTNGGNRYSKKNRKTHKKFRKFERKTRNTKRHIHPINKY